MNEQNNNEEKLLAEQETGVEKVAGQVGEITKEQAKQAVKRLKLKLLSAIVGFLIHLIPVLLIFMLVFGIIFYITGLFNGNNDRGIEDERAYITTTLHGIMLSDENEIFEEIKKQLGTRVRITDLGLGNEENAKKYLYKFYKTALSTQLPYIEGADRISDRYVQGMVHILRTSTTAEEARELKWMQYEDFEEEITKENPSSDMVNYFTLDKNWNLCIVTSKEHKKNGITDSYELEKQEIPYQSYISKYTVPFRYIMTMQQITRNPDYISKMCDMFTKDKEIHYTIFDTMKTTTTTTTYKHSIMRKWVETGTTTVTDDRGIPLVSPDGSLVTTPYSTNKRSEAPEPQPDEVTVEEQIENTIMCNVTYAKTWYIQLRNDYKKEPLDPVYPLGEAGITLEIPDEAEPAGDEGTWKVNQSENLVQREDSFEWIIEKKVGPIENPGEFIGLWRNKEGKYEYGAMGQTEKAGGKLVYYKKPYVGEETIVEEQPDPEEGSIKKESPVPSIMQVKAFMVKTLLEDETTQTYAEIMSEILHEYSLDKTFEPTNLDEPVYDEDTEIDASIFDSEEFVPVPDVYDEEGNIINNASYSSLNLTQEDFEILCRITSAERGNGTQQQQEYVVSVILNRVLSSRFPNTVRGVVFAPNQFQPTSNGAYERARPTATTINAVRNVIENGDTTHGALYFMTVAASQTAAQQAWLRNCIFLFNDADGSSNTHNFYTTSDGQHELSQYNRVINGRLAEVAKRCHDFLRNNNYFYSSQTNINRGGPPASGRDGASVGRNLPISMVNVEARNKRYIDCSAYVTWVLMEAGYISNTPQWQFTSYTFMANPWGFEEVSLSNLQPGDILVRSDHVEIYAGNGRTYSCGSTNSIRAVTSSYSDNFTKALRP